VYGYTNVTSASQVDWDKFATYGPAYMKQYGTEMSNGHWWVPASTNNYKSANRGVNDIDMIVIHSSEGYTAGLSAFRDPARGASAHYGVQWNGEIAQMVDTKDVAWHAGSGSVNDRSIGIEHAGFAVVGPEMWQAPQLKASAKLVASLARKNGIPLDRDHIIGHYQIPNQTHFDPGDHWPWDRYMSLVKWYYVRPYVFGIGALAVVGTGTVLLWGRKERKRIESWKRV
jgi:N-acetyl-anhydromuramyl-L-alanine amidase AmpD